MKFEFNEVYPKIFVLSFDSEYDLAMHFLRFQEYYESPNPSFRNNVFSLIDYMEWYSKSFGRGCFTYPNDWGGFNISGCVIHDVFKKGIPDINKYDLFMKKLFNTMRKRYGKEFYLIGIKKGDESTYKHELSHAFWNMIPEYKEEMKTLLKSIPKELNKAIRKFLSDNMYDESVLDDEIHAYLSTGLNSGLKDYLKDHKNELKETMKLFEKVFDKYFACIV